MVLGLAMLLGGWKHKELKFSRIAGESSSSVMVLAVVALVIPAIYANVTQHKNPGHIESMSLDISWVLLLTYAASLLFQLKSHKHLFAGEHGEATDEARTTAPLVGRRRASPSSSWPRASWAGSASSWCTRWTRRATPWAWARCSWAWWWWPSSATPPSTPPPSSWP